ASPTYPGKGLCMTGQNRRADRLLRGTRPVACRDNSRAARQSASCNNPAVPLPRAIAVDYPGACPCHYHHSRYETVPVAVARQHTEKRRGADNQSTAYAQYVNTPVQQLLPVLL